MTAAQATRRPQLSRPRHMRQYGKYLPYGVLVIVEVIVASLAQGDAYYTSIALQWATFTILAQGFNVIAGYAGRLAFGNTIFFGVAAYIVAAGSVNGWYPQLVGLVLALVVCCALAYLMSIALWRVNGLLFALATFAISAMLGQLATISGELGGSNGLEEPLPLGGSLLHLAFVDQWDFVVVGAVLVVLCCLASHWFRRSRTGREVQAVREDRVAAGTAGINARRVTALAWVVSAAMSAVGGVFYAQYNLFVDPPSVFGLPTITLIVVPAILGGLGTLWGPLLGSVIIPVGLLLARLSGNDSISELNLIVYGAVLIIVMRVYPGGLTAIGGMLRNRAGRRLGENDAENADGSSSASPSADPADVTAGDAPAAPTGAVVLRLSGIHKRFGGVKVLEGVGLDIAQGEIVGLLGPNGAGKSTLINCIAGVLSPDSGTIEFDGHDVTSWPSHRRSHVGIARTYQTARLFGELSVEENVLVGTLRRPDRAELEERSSAVLRSVGLANAHSTTASALSLIDQRRLELARAVATGARLIMLDEVMTGLNEEEAHAVRALVRALNVRYGTSFVVVEHVMGHILPLISRVVVLDQGRVLADGTPRECLERPDVIEAYFGKGAL